MAWRQKAFLDLEIAPDEIFLDASSAEFDRERFEGRLEKPLSHETFLYLFGVLALVFLVLMMRVGYLQVARGAAYAEESANNSLASTPLFAPRGIIFDRHGAVLAENRETQDGIMERYYPYTSASQIIGYVSQPKKDASGKYYDLNQTGVTGIEAIYDESLSGRNGELLVETDALGRIRSQGTVVPPIKGEPLKLSIDAGLQEHFDRAISHVVERSGFIAGAGVIMDAASGAVRAMVSYPSYDSNVMASGKPAEVIRAYNSDPGRPFLDHAIQGVYAPGSIVKPFVSWGALTDGIITDQTVINDPGFLSLPDPYNPGKNFIFKGWKALGPVDVKKAIAWSSDVFFYAVGGGFKEQRGLGIGRLKYWYEQFGMGTTTGIAMTGESPGLIPDPIWKRKVFNEPWYLGDTYFTSIGQYSMQVTPIQMARATGAIANGGTLYTPTLIEGEATSGKAVPVNTAHLPLVRKGMRESVTGALAQALNVPYVAVAAKTGTAQTGTRNQYDNSWVIGFFPYENPQYVFSVVLERGPAGTGEKAVNVMRELFDSLYEVNSPYVGGSATTTVAR